MDILHESLDLNKKTFLGHVFSTTEEGKAEVLNVVQYAILGIIPIVVLNKLIQRFIPEPDSDKSSIELLVEVFIQLIVMFCGIIVIHRVITYIPTYSEFKYESLTLTNVILAFLVIVLSIQSKLGIKVNILIDRLSELWNGPPPNEKRSGSGSGSSRGHNISQADYYDSVPTHMELPAPIATSKPVSVSTPSHSPSISDYGSYSGPVAANSMLGGSFGSLF